MDQKPPARTLIEENVPIVLATDHNPGSCTLLSLPLTMTMACLDFGLRPAETLAACTLNAAGSLNCSDTRGRIDPGLNADFVFWDVEDFREIPYWFGQNRVNTVYTRGTPVYNNENPSPHQQ